MIGQTVLKGSFKITQGLNKIELTENSQDTITSLMQNCIDLLSTLQKLNGILTIFM